MTERELYGGFSEEEQKEHEQEARERWGNENVDESVKRWGSYSKEKKDAIMTEGEHITLGIRDAMPKGYDSPEVQRLIAAWHNHLRYFYEPTWEVLAGLGHLYVEDPRFAAFYRRIHPELPEFLGQAIAYYCEHGGAGA